MFLILVTSGSSSEDINDKKVQHLKRKELENKLPHLIAEGQMLENV